MAETSGPPGAETSSARSAVPPVEGGGKGADKPTPRVPSSAGPWRRREAERVELRGPFQGPDVNPPSKPSQSLLAHLDECPYSGALYLKYGGGVGSHAMDRGSAFHDFAERATRLMQETGEVQLNPDVTRDLMQQVLAERSDLVVKAKEQEALRAMAWNFGTGCAIDPAKLVCVETMIELAVQSPRTGKVWYVRGKLDRAERHGTEGWVHDYKSSRSIPSEESYRDSFQRQFYALLLSRGVYAHPDERSAQEGLDPALYGERVAEGLSVVHTVEHYPRYTYQETGELVNNRDTMNQAAIEDFLQWGVMPAISRLEDGLDTGKWSAIPSSHCGICPARHDCPLPQELRDEYAPPETPEEAVEMGEWALFLENATKKIKGRLRAYVDEHGEFAVGDQVFGLHPRESRRVKDHDKLAAALRKGGANAEDYVGVSVSTRFDHQKKKAA